MTLGRSDSSLVGRSRCSSSCILFLMSMLTGVSSNLSTFLLHPTAEQLHQRRRRHLQKPINETHRQLKQTRNSAVYASLSDEHEEGLSDEELEFYQYRHLSRYERTYREKLGLDLQLDWDRTYAHDIERSLQQEQKIRHGASYNYFQSVPLSQGYGTHYAHLWVGSPKAQRKSVIVDTGSHYTAFPCKGCENCGEEHHTDAYFDPGLSSTFRALTCNNCQLGAVCKTFKCVITQSYTEGSSWEAYQVQDLLHLGGNDILASVNPSSQSYTIPFMFGCQMSENGLFVTQLADGIMGMSAHDMTITKQLYDNKKIPHKLFSLCFRRELGTSRKGVTAGFMTLGGMDTRMDTSPLIFAKNTATSGWFTVYVKNILIRAGGGQSATSKIEDNQHILKIPLDLNAVNSGKGVIVDSGTTDTYLHKKLSKSFVSVWKQVTKTDYNHNGIALTDDQVRRLPTILVQCQSFDYSADQTLGQPNDVVGYAGSLDSTSSYDLLIAIPASNYMEYSPTTNLYTSRLYFTETHGGVLGANAMQGHNVIFDWENGRVGFAESSCNFADEHSAQNLDKDIDIENAENGMDCSLKPPVISKACIKSLDTTICRQKDASIAKLHGTETWTYLVEHPGSSQGLACSDVALMASTYAGPLPPKVECDGAGLCMEYRPCDMSCSEVDDQSNILKATITQYCPGAFSACDFDCSQTLLSSAVRSDGNCHEVARSSRSCHKDACGGNDPCRVPYLVQGSIGFRGAKRALWSLNTNERFASAVVNTVHRKLTTKKSYFDIGDIKVMLVSRLSDGTDSSVDDVGVKVVFQISLFNPNAKVLAYVEDPVHGNETIDKDLPRGRNLVNQVFRTVKTMLGRPRATITTCIENDLYPLANNAHAVRNILEEEDFVRRLIGELKKSEGGDKNFVDSPLQDMYNNQDFVADSLLLTSWTVRTEVEESYQAPPGIVPPRIRQYAFNWNFMVAFTCTALFVICWTYEKCASGGFGRVMEKYSMLLHRPTDSKVSSTSQAEADEELFDQLFQPIVTTMTYDSEEIDCCSDTDRGEVELRVRSVLKL
jgi:Xylanase inhibitor N-terminal